MYLCGLHYFDNCMLLNGVTFLYAMTSTPDKIEYTTMLTTGLGPVSQQIVRAVVDIKCA